MNKVGVMNYNTGDMDLRNTSHYIIFRIGADTDIHNGRTDLVVETLKKMELKEDYAACQALYDALEFSNSTISAAKTSNF